MKLKDYIKMAKGADARQLRIYIERNKDYAGENDTLLNDKLTCAICEMLNIDVRLSGEEVSWFRLIDKLCRDRVRRKQDNLDDAQNYIRRIMAWRQE